MLSELDRLEDLDMDPRPTSMESSSDCNNTAPGFVVPRDRPEMVEGITRRMPTGCGNLYVTINCDERGMIEVFSAMGKGGGCAGALNEAVGRLVSLCLRSGVDPKDVARQLMGIRCPSPCWKDGEQILSCADAVARALKSEIKVEPQIQPNIEPTTPA